MAGETIITVVGNLTTDPDLRFTPNGSAVANFTVASTPRTFDRRTNEFKDGETMFLRCAAWRDLGENVASSLAKGTRVIVQGRLRARTFETKEGENRTVFELDVDEVGPSLRYATAAVRRNERPQDRGRDQQWGRDQPTHPQGQPHTVHGAGNGTGQATDDPWATQPQGQAAGGWGQEPPADDNPF
ncbi:single-stranded DNA-binding protein [Brevibacterium sp. 91QC2O2]|uniref:single-stranded DNA-binding protein n=1 Tax=Brevibacterium sp. 91QC2O2 TaxID=2968458 RepID=UPI00211C8EF9|nr:single-stranded DNA-binding protein [Brevibacterium sp. 91QC2O2]MCQ9367971.1 single-stranded DNA-binding protein [Brevibacterium sp. 91QC2O2]